MIESSVDISRDYSHQTEETAAGSHNILTSSRNEKLKYGNEEINKELEKTVTAKRNIRSLKYRNKNFDWKHVQYLNGGETLLELIVAFTDS